MKYFITLTTVFLLCQSLSSQTPFTKGVNLTSWFQQSSVRQVQFTKYTKQDFINIKELGCNVIRLPIDLHSMTLGAPNYLMDPLFFFFLDQVVDWTEELELHLILDNHSFDPPSTDPNIENVLIKVWLQMADHYKNRNNYLYYEILNEPHDMSDASWNRIQLNVINAIRQIDSTHSIIIGPAGWNGYNNLQYMPVYADTNLIYTFHFYEPFLFTHQGATWTDPSMGPVTDIPFPYDAGSMPSIPTEMIGTWVASAYGDYNNKGKDSWVQQQIDIAISFKSSRNVPLFCGEFGVYIPNSINDQRVNWYNTVCSYLEQNGISWTIWDYQGGFGLFEEGTNAFFDHDLNIPLVEALGLNTPTQSEYIKQPDSTGFNLYFDYFEPGITAGSNTAQGVLSYYYQELTYQGLNSVFWTGASQYNHIGFDFRPVKDLSYLLENGFSIDFWVLGDTPDAQFVIRFIDTKTSDPNDHPWRMFKTINSTVVPFNGEWQHVQIPLAQFSEQGSWDGAWFPPQGDFDWTEVDNFQIVAEYGDMTNITFLLDNICVTSPNDPNNIINNPRPSPLNFELKQNYPNPFNPMTLISYSIPEQSTVRINVYDMMGREVANLVNEKQYPGKYNVSFNGSTLSSGVYYYRIETARYSEVKKMILIK